MTFQVSLVLLSLLPTSSCLDLLYPSPVKGTHFSLHITSLLLPPTLAPPLQPWSFLHMTFHGTYLPYSFPLLCFTTLPIFPLPASLVVPLYSYILPKKKESMWYFVFWVWFISLSTIISSSIHLLANNAISLFFIAEENFTMYVFPCFPYPLVC